LDIMLPLYVSSLVKFICSFTMWGSIKLSKYGL